MKNFYICKNENKIKLLKYYSHDKFDKKITMSKEEYSAISKQFKNNSEKFKRGIENGTYKVNEDFSISMSGGDFSNQTTILHTFDENIKICNITNFYEMIIDRENNGPCFITQDKIYTCDKNIFANVDDLKINDSFVVYGNENSSYIIDLENQAIRPYKNNIGNIVHLSNYSYIISEKNFKIQGRDDEEYFRRYISDPRYNIINDEPNNDDRRGDYNSSFELPLPPPPLSRAPQQLQSTFTSFLPPPPPPPLPPESTHDDSNLNIENNDDNLRRRLFGGDPDHDTHNNTNSKKPTLLKIIEINEINKFKSSIITENPISIKEINSAVQIITEKCIHMCCKKDIYNSVFEHNTKILPDYAEYIFNEEYYLIDAYNTTNLCILLILHDNSILIQTKRPDGKKIKEYDLSMPWDLMTKFSIQFADISEKCIKIYIELKHSSETGNQKTDIICFEIKKRAKRAEKLFYYENLGKYSICNIGIVFAENKNLSFLAFNRPEEYLTSKKTDIRSADASLYLEYSRENKTFLIDNIHVSQNVLPVLNTNEKFVNTQTYIAWVNDIDRMLHIYNKHTSLLTQTKIKGCIAFTEIENTLYYAYDNTPDNLDTAEIIVCKIAIANRTDYAIDKIDTININRSDYIIFTFGIFRYKEKMLYTMNTRNFHFLYYSNASGIIESCENILILHLDSTQIQNNIISIDHTKKEINLVRPVDLYNLSDVYENNPYNVTNSIFPRIYNIEKIITDNFKILFVDIYEDKYLIICVDVIDKLSKLTIVIEIISNEICYIFNSGSIYPILFDSYKKRMIHNGNIYIENVDLNTICNLPYFKVSFNNGANTQTYFHQRYKFVMNILHESKMDYHINNFELNTDINFENSDTYKMFNVIALNRPNVYNIWIRGLYNMREVLKTEKMLKFIREYKPIIEQKNKNFKIQHEDYGVYIYIIDSPEKNNELLALIGCFEENNDLVYPQYWTEYAVKLQYLDRIGMDVGGIRRTIFAKVAEQIKNTILEQTDELPNYWSFKRNLMLTIENVKIIKFFSILISIANTLGDSLGIMLNPFMGVGHYFNNKNHDEAFIEFVNYLYELQVNNKKNKMLAPQIFNAEFTSLIEFVQKSTDRKINDYYYYIMKMHFYAYNLNAIQIFCSSDDTGAYDSVIENYNELLVPLYGNISITKENIKEAVKFFISDSHYQICGVTDYDENVALEYITDNIRHKQFAKVANAILQKLIAMINKLIDDDVDNVYKLYGFTTGINSIPINYDSPNKRIKFVLIQGSGGPSHSQQCLVHTCFNSYDIPYMLDDAINDDGSVNDQIIENYVENIRIDIKAWAPNAASITTA